MERRGKLLGLICLSLVFLIGLASADCINATDLMNISEDTTLCQDVYNLSNGIFINASNIVIDCNGSTIAGGNYDCGQGSEDGVNFNNNTNVTLKNCIIEYYLRGTMDVGNSSNLTNNTFNSVCLSIVSAGSYLEIASNNFTNSKSHSFYGAISHSRIINNSFVTGNGLSFLGNSYNNTIENNTFGSGSIGIYFSGYGTGDWQRGLWRIFGNTFTNRTYGIRAFNLFNSLISNNTLTNNSVGLSLFNSTNNTITNNTLQNNTITTPHTDWFFVNTTDCINAYGDLEVEVPIDLSLVENDSACTYNLTINTITRHDFEIQGSTNDTFLNNGMQTLSFSGNESGYRVVANLNLINSSGLNETELTSVSLQNTTFDNVTARIGALINLSSLLGSGDYNDTYFLFEGADLEENESIFYFPYDNQTFYESLPCANNSKPASIPEAGCYVNYSSNLILYVPHFSSAAIGELIVITATEEANTDSPGSSSSSSSAPSFWTNTFVLNENETSAFEGAGLTKELSSKNQVRIKVNGSNHHVGIINLTTTTITINVSSTPQQAVFNIGDEKMFDVNADGYYDIKIKLNSISNNKANITLSLVKETLQVVEDKSNTEEGLGLGTEESTSDERGLLWLWITLGVVLVLLIAGAVFWYFRRGNKKRK